MHKNGNAMQKRVDNRIRDGAIRRGKLEAYKWLVHAGLDNKECILCSPDFIDELSPDVITNGAGPDKVPVHFCSFLPPGYSFRYIPSDFKPWVEFAARIGGKA